MPDAERGSLSSAILADTGGHRLRVAGNRFRRCYLSGMFSVAMASQRS